jgi:peptidoglycan/LPS O-acetylase OafA/YrhL
MRSSSGEYFIALDHVRAVAAFLVVTWHFTHAATGYPIPFEFVPAVFPLALLDEGHTGVALFMTLSGYLFAKLLDGRKISFSAFLRNRALRLLPLLLLVIALVGIQTVAGGGNAIAYLVRIAQGVALPTLPNGGWSITAEFHFYALLPFFLALLRRARGLLAWVLLIAILTRIVIYLAAGEVQSLAYWTIVGRIDQFLLGMLAWHYRSLFIGRHAFALASLLAFAVFYWYFDAAGGFYKFPSYPSSSPLWIVLPTIEGFAYAIAIAYYDNSFAHSSGRISRFFGLMGTYSYSIYLLHFFFVFRAARFVHEKVMPISDFYAACLWSGVFFLLLMPLGYLSYRFIEEPFLRLRRRYVVGRPEGQSPVSQPSLPARAGD